MNVVDHFVGFEGAGAQLFHVVALNDSIADLAVGEIPEILIDVSPDYWSWTVYPASTGRAGRRINGVGSTIISVYTSHCNHFKNEP